MYCYNKFKTLTLKNINGHKPYTLPYNRMLDQQ